MKISTESHFYDNYITTKFDIAYALSKALDLVNPVLNNHHQRVAFISGCIASEAGYTNEDIEQVVLAALIHDIGVIVEKEFRELAAEDEVYEKELSHVLVGSYLVNGFDIFPNASQLIKYHHTPYNIKDNLISKDEDVPELAHIIHLADRIDILLKRNKPALEQRNTVIDKITGTADKKFHPKHLDAFLRLSEREHFWFDIEEPEKYPLIKYNFKFSHINMNIDNMLETAKLLSRIIDFRCVFTATHSAGVATVAYELSKLLGMKDVEQKAARIAGYMHDIGKLAVPSEILYKEGALTTEEIEIVRKHPYYTYTILNNFQVFETIKDWASFHHEHLDGSGYPFHLNEDRLCKGCRLLAVSDIFTAMTESRPYRDCEPKEELTKTFHNLAESGVLDSEIVDTLIENYDLIFQAREKAQIDAQADFDKFRKNILESNALCDNTEFINVLKS